MGGGCLGKCGVVGVGGIMGVAGGGGPGVLGYRGCLGGVSKRGSHMPFDRLVAKTLAASFGRTFLSSG